MPFAPQITLAPLQPVTPVLPQNTTTLSIDSSVLPLIITADTNTIRLEVSIYNTTTVLQNFVVTGGLNQFTTNLPITPTVQETIVQLIGRNYDPTTSWLGATLSKIGSRFADSNGNVQVAVQAGLSGILQPVWNPRTPTPITRVQISSNILTVTTTNTFMAGQQIYLTGLTNATFLNGVLVTIVTASSTQFTAAFNRNDYAATIDVGLAQATTIDNGVIWANVGIVGITPIVKLNLLFFQSNLAVVIAPPSGISAKKNQTDCTLEWVTPDYPGFIGVRVMVSTDAAGINPPYVQFGDLVTSVERTAPVVIDTQTNTAVNIPVASVTNVAISNNVLTVTAINSFSQGTVVELTGLINATFLNGESLTITSASGTAFVASFTYADYTSTPDNGEAVSIISTNTVTKIETIMTTNYSSVDIPSSLMNSNIFYALFSTVIQDPTSNTVYESVQNGPLLAGFVNLKVVKPTDFLVLQRKEDIAGRIIGQIVRQRKNIDLSPRSEIRDVFIDPFSIEVANMSVREWFARVSTSISAITQLDDTTGTGVSDPFASSPYKQQIARAYGLSPQDTQRLIDEQFDILGEQAGQTRGASSASTDVLTFYTYQQPQSSITIPQNAVVATLADSNTPALNFITQGQAVIDVTNLASFYNAQTGWWAVNVPSQCATTGSNGNVGAATIRQVVSNVPSGLNVTNLSGAQFGADIESNSRFAARIQARIVTGVDSGSRHGYLETALSTPGIIDAQVVAAGDLEMLRDWDAIRQKHVFGTVDIYTRGTTFSQQDEHTFYRYQNTGIYGTSNTYLSLIFSGGTKFQISNFSSLNFPLYSAYEVLITRVGSSFYLGTARAQFDNVNGFTILNPNDMAYQYVGSSITKTKVPLLINGNPATNAAAIAALQSAVSGTYTAQLYARYKSTFNFTPTLQPVLQVFGVTGQAGQTGTLPNTVISLIHNSDFLLSGGSNAADDFIRVNISSAVTTKTITALSSAPVVIDTAMDVPLDTNGSPLDVLSVRSTDLSTLYKQGVDYTIAPTGPYHAYGLQILLSSIAINAASCVGNVLTILAPNEFGVGAQITFSAIPDPVVGPILNGQTVTIGTVSSSQFTATFGTNFALATISGNAAGSAIQNNQQVVVAYNKFLLYERLTFVSQEVQVLKDTTFTPLGNNGFVENTWLPESYSNTSLTSDGWNGLYGVDGGLDILGSTGLVGAGVSHDARYIKVTFFNGVTDVIKKEGLDFTLTVDPVSGAASIARIITGSIPNGGTVKVSYFYTEPFTISTQYPAFVEVLSNTIAQTKHAAADVLIKAMVASPVDITLSVTLQANAAPETVDPVIRTVINIVLDNATLTLYQSELIRQIQAITGVQSVEVPLIRCAKADGSYDIGVVIPTGTLWTPLAQDPLFATLQIPANAWISTSAILPDSTLPSGGQPEAVVDFLYEGQVFRRALTVTDFLTNSPAATNLASAATPGSFYIIGLNDQINSNISLPASYQQKILLVVPHDIPNPGNLNFLCTYQVFAESGAKDVTVSATEYLAPGKITVNYLGTS